MYSLFEATKQLNSPIEAFQLSSNSSLFPIKSHWHYFCEILYITEGSGHIIYNGKTYEIHEHDLVFFKPMAIHGIYSDGYLCFDALKFDMNTLKSSGTHIAKLSSLFNVPQDDECMPVVMNERFFWGINLQEIFEKCIYEIQGNYYGYDIAVQANITTLLIHVLRLWRYRGFDTDKAPDEKKDRDIETITEYIAENLALPLKVEELAASCHMSYSYFAKKFKDIYGKSCKEYIEYMRVSKAKDLLLFTDFDLSFISQETGFSDCSHLIRTFKKFEKLTPKQFRKLS